MKSWLKGLGLAALATAASIVSQSAGAGHIGKDTLIAIAGAVVPTILAYLTHAPSQKP